MILDFIPLPAARLVRTGPGHRDELTENSGSERRAARLPDERLRLGWGAGVWSGGPG